VKIVVDANIVFSGILNTNSTIADLLINSQSIFTFISPDFLQTEIRKHYHRIRVISGLTLEQIKEAELSRLVGTKISSLFHLNKSVKKSGLLRKNSKV